MFADINGKSKKGAILIEILFNIRMHKIFSTAG